MRATAITICDLTQIDLTINETAAPGRAWDLGGDVADNILAANPHADKFGNTGVWSFVEGPTRSIGNLKVSDSAIPLDSVLGRWRAIATDPARQADAAKLAVKPSSCCCAGLSRPTKNRSPTEPSTTTWFPPTASC